MAGTFTIKSLGDGQLAATKGTLYTVPTLTQAIIKSITLVNTSASAVTVNLYLKPGATSRRVAPKDLSIPAGALVELTAGYTLGAGNLIEGDASAATIVDYTINGVEEN